MSGGMSPERRYAEEAAVVIESLGLPRAYGKLLGWLLICEPPQQTGGELAAALDLSKGSVSTGMRLLENSGLVRRVAAPGRRGKAYEMVPDAFARAADSGSYRAFRELMERGLAVVGEASPRARRLRFTRDFYAFIERELPRLVNEFLRQKAREGEGDG